MDFYAIFYIQGDSGGICNTLRNDSMCDSKQKSSYEHGSDFERLPRYGKKKIRTNRALLPYILFTDEATLILIIPATLIIGRRITLVLLLKQISKHGSP